MALQKRLGQFPGLRDTPTQNQSLMRMLENNIEKKFGIKPDSTSLSENPQTQMLELRIKFNSKEDDEDDSEENNDIRPADLKITKIRNFFEAHPNFSKSGTPDTSFGTLGLEIQIKPFVENYQVSFTALCKELNIVPSESNPSNDCRMM